MKTSPWLRLLFSVMAVFALALFAACGDDDDDDNEEGRDPTTTSTGGDDQSTPDTDDDDDDDDDDGSGGGGSASEEAYVADLCSAFNEFMDSLIDVGNDPDALDATEEEQLELLREPFANFVNAIDDADPPGDVEEFHENIVDAFREMVDRIEDGDTSVFESDPTENIPEPSAEVQAKYNRISSNNPECQAAGFTFGE